MFYKTIISFVIIFFSTSISFSNDTTVNGKFVQGGIVIGQNKSAKKIFFDDNRLQISKDGYFIFGFGRNHKASSTLKIIKDSNDEVIKYNFDIEKTIYKIEKINGLPNKMVTPGPEFYKKITEDRALIKKSMNKKYIGDKFPLTFIKPTEGRISGIYGSQRILNGIKKNPHGGLDIAAPEGTPIKATSDGKVMLAAKGLYYTGNIVIIDHGYGLKSMYIHMKDININNGDLVKQGQIIGTVGSTGRSTGPHLHWNIYWNKIRVNPEMLLTISK
jgi:murein DD-endopeptidase MepM/ murein hydrolase activator NlpD